MLITIVEPKVCYFKIKLTSKSGSETLHYSSEFELNESTTNL